MHLLVVAYFAGILTAAAPCILPLLPVIVGGTVVTTDKKQSQWWRPLLIVGSLAGSVVIFTLLLKATTTLLGVPQLVWNIISGVIVLLFGISLLLPKVWEVVALKSGLYAKANQLMQHSNKQQGIMKDVVLGASLGPVFSSCSPTYALIVAVVLPQSFLKGLSYLIAYALGLATILLLIAIAGQSIVRKLGWLSNPAGWFRKCIGLLFVLVGLAVLTGYDRKFQTYVLERGWYDPIMKLEQKLE